MTMQPYRECQQMQTFFWKDNERIGYKTPYSAMFPELSSDCYVCDHATLPRISENAGFSTPLKCLASGKKSVEQLCPSMPWQTSALELLVFYCFTYLLYIPVHYTMEC